MSTPEKELLPPVPDEINVDLEEMIPQYQAPFAFRTRDNNVTVMINMPHSGTQMVDVFSANFDRESIQLTPTMAGKLVSISYLNTPMVVLCYLPYNTVADVKEFDGMRTIFICADGLHILENGSLVPVYQVEDALFIQPPHDTVYYCIPDVNIDKPNNLLKYDVVKRSFTFTHPIAGSPFAVSIYSPHKESRGLYTLVAEGHDSLKYTDLEVGYVVGIDYISKEGAVTEYARIVDAKE